MPNYTRREWLTLTAAATAGARSFRLGSTEPDDLDTYIEGVMRARKIPGLAASLVKGQRVVWSHGYGWANIARRIPMNPDRSIQNIASVSKTVTATAIMQLVEQRKLQLDADVNQYLPFAVRSPHHPEVPITVRQLLTHRSGIADGPAYGASYACGDPTLDLRAWLESYLVPNGKSYDAARNFQPWTPGEQGPLTGAIGRSYTNVGFGLLGFLAGAVAGIPFPQYCRHHIFAPLGMTRTAWHLADIDRADHAIPYRVADRPGFEAEQRAGLLGTEPERESPAATAYLPYCLYSFPNYPDGTVRTSVNQLARFLMAYIQPAAGGLLAPDTVATMLAPQVKSDPRQGLCWVSSEEKGVRYWGHDGADPGVATSMVFRPSDGVGVVVFATSLTQGVKEVSTRLFEESARF